MMLAPSFAVDRPSRLLIETCTEDRWSFPRYTDKRPTILAVVALSVALHASFMTVLVMTGRSPVAPVQHEVSVEIVQDMPKPPSAKPPPKSEVAKLETPKVAPPKATAPPPPAPKPQVAKATDAPKGLPPPPATVEQEAAAPEPVKEPTADETRQLGELKKELAALKAEHAALETSASPGAAAPPAQGVGALANSFRAIALPGVGGSGEVVSYQEIVFSQLAKAKGLGSREGKPGTTGVRFEIDGAGALVSVEIAVPSGIPDLDSEALDIVRRAAPFPPPPKDAERQFSADVSFVPQAAP